MRTIGIPKRIEWVRDGECIICASHSLGTAGYPSAAPYRGGKRQHISRTICGRRHGPLGSLFARHTCDRKSCINPTHIIPGTRQQNVQDAVDRGRMPSGSNHWNSKLTESDVRKILESNELQSVLAGRFGVGPNIISRIKNRIGWRHIETEGSIPLVGKAFGERAGNAKLTEELVIQIRKSDGSHREIAHMFGIGKSAVNQIKNRKTWRHL